MIYLCLAGAYLAGMIAGVAAVLWAERLQEHHSVDANKMVSSQVILDSSTDNHDPRTLPEHRIGGTK
jgi:hypothetical protein